MFTYIGNAIINICINHTDFFIAFFMLRTRVENRTFCIVLKYEGGPEPSTLYVLTEDAYSLRYFSRLFGFSAFL